MYEIIQCKWLAIVLAAGVLTMLLSPRDASASTADWSTGYLMQSSGGVVHPAILVAFNPQPEPPEWTGGTQSSIVLDEFEQKVLVQKVTEVTNPVGGLQNFQFLFGVGSDLGPASIVIPIDPPTNFRIGFSIDAGGVPVEFTAIVDVQSSSGGTMAPGSALAFNPQPEPPDFGFGGFETYGLDFGMTSLSDVTLTLRIVDAAGNPLDLVAVPEPATLGMFVLALVGLEVVHGRRR